MNDSQVMLKIDRARWWALSEQPFYGSLLMRLDMALDPSIDTACTDGRALRINPAFVADMPDEELRFLLLHETLHCAHAHMWRLPPNKAGNIAGDHEINLTLTGADGAQIPGIKMPAGGLCDQQYRGMSCEEILAALPDDPEGDTSSCGGFSAPGAGDGGQDSPTPAPGAAEQLKAEWEQAVIQAAQAAQALGKGSIPADMARTLARIKHQPIDWRQELAEFVRQAGQGRNDWARSSRRMAGHPVIYPKRRQDEPGLIIVARDTSGSITDDLCGMFSAQVDSCASEHPNTEILVLDCDARIQAEYRVGRGEPCPVRAAGGGGTDFRPVFDRASEIQEDGESIAGIVYLTDLEGPEPESSEFPVLWLCITDRTAQTGRTIKIS